MQHYGSGPDRNEVASINGPGGAQVTNTYYQTGQFIGAQW